MNESLSAISFSPTVTPLIPSGASISAALTPPVSPRSSAAAVASIPVSASIPDSNSNLISSSIIWMGRQFIWIRGVFQQHPLMAYPVLIVFNLVFTTCAVRACRASYYVLPHSEKLTNNQKILKDMCIVILYTGLCAVVNINFVLVLELSINQKIHFLISVVTMVCNIKR